MIAARSAGSGTIVTMRVPGTIFTGAVSQRSSDARSQVMPACLSAAE